MAKLLCVRKWKDGTFTVYKLTPKGEEYIDSEANQAFKGNWSEGSVVDFEDISQMIADLEPAD